jgi:beta-lactamase class A
MLKKRFFYSNPRLASLLLIVLSFGAGFGVASYNAKRDASEPPFKQLRQTMLNQSPYTFIDPLLSCSIAEQKASIAFAPLKIKVDSVIQQKLQNNKASRISVYFDTRDGQWLGINANEKYYPGSLMKVPTLITILKIAESEPELLSKKVLFPKKSPNYNAAQHFKPTHSMVPGQYYTIEDLLFRTIAYSDNNSVPLLTGNVNPETLEEIYTDLGIHLPSSPDVINEDFMTVKDYARFFKFLYNASYLNRDMSEKALTFLSKTDFKEGLTAGTPASTIIAQKFGEHYLPDPTGRTNPPHELHDCGIVYHPNRPYLLCIMTKGNDYEGLKESIKDISKEVYQFIQHTSTLEE